MSETLYQIANEFNALRHQLEEEALSPAVIMDTLEGAALPFEVKATSIAALVLNLELENDKVLTVINRLAHRQKQITDRIAWLRTYLQSTMKATGIYSVQAADGSFRVKLYPGRDKGVHIDDLAAVPVQYLRTIPAKQEPDKTVIKEAMLLGKDVAGCRLEHRDRLEIRS